MSTPQPALPAVVFDHVSFGFDDHVVLRDISFSIRQRGMRGSSAPAALDVGVVCPASSRGISRSAEEKSTAHSGLHFLVERTEA